MSLLERDRTALVVVDVQEGFRPYSSFAGVADAVTSSCRPRASSTCRGSSASSIQKASATPLPRSGWREERPRIEKTVFSAARADGFDARGARDQALVCGIETHVCVSQTVHDLLDRGVEVHVPADAVGSRHAIDYERGLERMERAGAVVTTVEAALFELLRARRHARSSRPCRSSIL